MESQDLDTQLYTHLHESLKITPPPQLQTSVNTLQRLLQNITEHPEESKFRSIKKSNKAIQSKLLSTPFMTEILSLIGFRPQDSDTLSIQDDSNVDVALTMLQVFESEVKENLKSEEQKEIERRQFEIRKAAKEKEEKKKKVLEQAALDRKETMVQLIPTQDSHAINRAPVKAKGFKDIGVDLNTEKKG